MKELKTLANKLSNLRYAIIELEIRNRLTDVEEIELNELRSEYEELRHQLSKAKTKVVF